MNSNPNILQIVAEPRRQEILRLVWDREVASGTIASAIPDITIGAVSQHLRVLHDAGLVDMRKEGRFRLYQANREALGPLASYLTAVWSGHLTQLKSLAEAQEKAHARKKRR